MQLQTPVEQAQEEEQEFAEALRSYVFPGPTNWRHTSSGRIEKRALRAAELEELGWAEDRIWGGGQPIV